MSGAARRSCTMLAHAKLNLSLRILALEASGYHQIETVFCLIELADELEITIGGDAVELTVASPADSPGPPPDLGPVAQNLAHRAAAAFLEQCGVATGVAIRLVKRIPAGAGLGGGSSDAAAVLHGLNQLHDQPMPMPALLDLAAGLGSDVPFFAARAPLAIAWGRGGRIAPLPPLPARPVLLAVPAVRFATADAYAALDRARGPAFVTGPGLVAACDRSWDGIGASAANDFEAIAFAQVPQLAELRERMLAAGAFAARMTGSGSVIFGLFNDMAACRSAHDRLQPRYDDVDWIVTSTMTL